jgi:centromere protein S
MAMDPDPDLDLDLDLDLDMDMDMETLADDADAALAGDSGGEAERNEAAEAEAERYEAAEAEADILRDRFRLAVISIATAEGSVSSLSRLHSLLGVKESGTVS